MTKIFIALAALLTPVCASAQTSDVPQFGLTLASGASLYGAMTFPGARNGAGTTITNPNMPDSTTMRKYIYSIYDEDNLNKANVSPQDDGQGNMPAFWGRARTYAIGDPNDLIPVTSDGLKLKAHCSGAGYSNCSMGNVRTGFIRPVGRFAPGMSLQLDYKPAKGYNSWQPLWSFSGEELTPGPGGNPYGTGLWTAPGLPLYEVDWNDNFPRHDGGGCPVGGQIDFGTPTAGYGQSWTTAPHYTYAANSNGWSYSAPSGAEPFVCENAFVPGSRRVLFANWRNDGSNLIDIYINGKRVYCGYMEYNQNQTFNGHQLGMVMLIGGEAVPKFQDDVNSIVDNDGIAESATDPTVNGGWTETIYSFEMWNGNLANPTGYDAGSNACTSGC